jgi:diphthamide synthase (EF-2-diphthine--ammonia ligase)
VSGGWKYGLIKVALPDEGRDVQINMLVELYPLGETGEYDTFCRASPQTLEEIEMAKRDIERDGINEYFFNNGTFKWVLEKEAYAWDWRPNER